MKSKRTRLDRFLSRRLLIKRKHVRLLLAQGRVKVDHTLAEDIQCLVDEYTHVQFDNEILQANTPSYIQLNKPMGVVSATKDGRHSTVVELLAKSRPANLHIAGRLDLNSTGLLLLTNDGRWSRRLSSPCSQIKKTYIVGLDKTITPEVVEAFAKGIYFSFENITTQPVALSIFEPTINTIARPPAQYVKVTMQEGRYHQIKRMFGRFQIEVLTLHRISIGALTLDTALSEGESRHLTEHERDDIFRPLHQ